jgi:hypothetical protein
LYLYVLAIIPMVTLVTRSRYVIDCFGEGEPWRVAKRFSHFCELRARLEERGVHVPAAEQEAAFPPKVLFGRAEASVVEERRSKLESWLNQILSMAQSDLEVRKFLQNDGSWPMPTHAPAVDDNASASADVASPAVPASRDAVNEPCVVDYYGTGTGVAAAAAASRSEVEPELVGYYMRQEESGGGSSSPATVSFLGSVFESPLFSRFRGGRANPPSQEALSEAHGSGETVAKAEAETVEVAVATAAGLAPLSMVSYYAPASSGAVEAGGSSGGGSGGEPALIEHYSAVSPPGAGPGGGASSAAAAAGGGGGSSIFGRLASPLNSVFGRLSRGGADTAGTTVAFAEGSPAAAAAVATTTSPEASTARAESPVAEVPLTRDPLPVKRVNIYGAATRREATKKAKEYHLRNRIIMTRILE